MKKILLLIISLTFILSGCGVMESEFTVKLSGTPGMQVNGAYMVTTPSGASTSKSIEVTLPHEFKAKGNIISVNFQKHSEKGQLKLEVIKDGKVISKSDTSAAYGIVSAATN